VAYAQCNAECSFSLGQTPLPKPLRQPTSKLATHVLVTRMFVKYKSSLK
jgi:hypothetical protein